MLELSLTLKYDFAKFLDSFILDSWRKIWYHVVICASRIFGMRFVLVLENDGQACFCECHYHRLHRFMAFFVNNNWEVFCSKALYAPVFTGRVGNPRRSASRKWNDVVYTTIKTTDECWNVWVTEVGVAGWLGVVVARKADLNWRL